MTPNGRLTDLTFRSHALLRPMRLRAYLPPDYEEAREPLPTVYLLHPWGQDERWWTDVMRFHQAADHLITMGALPPFVAVMPQGDKSFFINAANPGGDYQMLVDFDPDHYAGALDGFGDYGDYLLRDVLDAAERRFPLRRDRRGRVIAGVSMGGAGAAVLAFTRPDLFCGAGIHSPALFDETQLGPPWLFGLGDPRAFAERDPVQLAGRLDPRAGLRIYLDCGQQDDLATRTEALHDALAARRVQHTYVSRPGSHTLPYWQAHLAEYLGFYAAGW